MKPRTGIIVFARMSSSRLPGKMLRDLGGRTLLERVIERARCVHPDVVLATSQRPDDDALADAAEKLGVPHFRGSLDDVMGRAVRAAREHGFEAFARLCGDRPLFPLDDMRRGLALMEESMASGQLTDLITTHAPRPVPAGLTTEIIRTEALTDARSQTEDARDLEHVTTYFYDHPERFEIVNLETRMRDFSGLHFSIDQSEDARRIGLVFEKHPEVDLPVELAASVLSGASKQANEANA
ncbi:cytidylyltransferase domain-containing protein [Wenzhouxiangella sp. EGI_FJ10305]|uniref:cytidylyltransferase domain-containing protein n=1 Tax=Wenzhouxiangella sp. EGI_FJ10305 TaxID=3243768 RepID=UPI0035D918FC